MSETISAPQGFFQNDTVTPATITDLLSAVEAANANLSSTLAAEVSATASAAAATTSATSAAASASSATSSASSASTSASTASGAASTATTEASAASTSATSAASSASSASSSQSSASTSATGASNSASTASTSATSASTSASSAASSLASLLAVNPLSTTSVSAQSVASGLTFNGAITLAATLSATGAFTVTLSPSGSGQVIIAPNTAGTMNNMAIGGSTAQAGTFTALTATGAVGLSPASANVTLSPTGSGEVIVNPATAGTIDNMVVGGTTPKAGTFTTLSATGAVGLSPASANVTLSPTGSGEVIVNPATAGTIDNMVIGGTTPKAGTFTSLTFTGAVNFSPSNANVTLSPTGSGEVIINPATAGTMDNVVVGGTTPLAGHHTTLSTSGLYTPSAGIKGETAAAAAGNIGEQWAIRSPGGSLTVTISNASPTVVTGTHGMTVTAGITACHAVYFTTTGSLPTGLTASQTYYAVIQSATTVKVATTVANALAGTFVNTSSAGSGTQTMHLAAIMGNNSAQDVAGMALTAGDWDYWGAVADNLLSSSITVAECSVNTSSATMNFDTLQESATQVAGFAPAQSTGTGMTVSASAQNVFLTTLRLSSANTDGYGRFFARRRQ